MNKYFHKLHKVQKKDIDKASSVFAKAFEKDPVWKKVLYGNTFSQKKSFFESPVRYGLTYGHVYASSKKMEGLAVWVPSQNADMTFWRGLRSGSILPSFRIGLKKISQMKEIFEPLDKSRKDNMKGREYLYFMILGVDPEFQGQGFGKKLIEALIKESELKNLPIYLETATKKNMSMYEHFGFKLLNRIDHPIINVPQWAMVRKVS